MHIQSVVAQNVTMFYFSFIYLLRFSVLYTVLKSFLLFNIELLLIYIKQASNFTNTNDIKNGWDFLETSFLY